MKIYDLTKGTALYEALSREKPMTQEEADVEMLTSGERPMWSSITVTCTHCDGPF